VTIGILIEIYTSVRVFRASEKCIENLYILLDTKFQKGISLEVTIGILIEIYTSVRVFRVSEKCIENLDDSQTTYVVL